MKSDLHQMVSEYEYWTFGLIENVCGCTCARAHAESVKMCIQPITHHISAKLSWISTKNSMIIGEVSR